MQIYFHSRISNLPFSDVQLDSRENDPPRSIYIRTFHRRWGVRSLRIEAGGGVWRRPLNRDTHSGRKSLWILCKGQLFRSTNDRSMHSKSARITTHRYFFCTLQPMDSIRIALCSSTIVFVCLCLCARACLVFLRPAAIYRFFLFPLSPSSLRFHRTTVVKIYAKSSSLPYIRR